ncbi:MAG: CHASE3 domain-containing protein [Peptostreptococcaceae bacterium]
MKKKFIIIIASVATVLIAVNIYAYINYSKIENYIDELSISRRKIVLLDTFRSDIVRASQFQRLYILTGKESYRNDFKTSISSITKQINESYDKGYISSTEKAKLISTIDSFNNYSIGASANIETYSISNQVEKEIIDYNTYQLNILHQITLDISSEDASASQNNDKITTSSATQTKLIQGVSTFLTVVGSGVGLYFKNHLKKENINIDDIIEYLTKHEDATKKDTTASNDSNTSINLNELKEKVSQNEVLLSNAKLLYTQSLKFKNECEKSESLLEDIDIYVEKLKTTLQLIEDYPTSAQKIILEDIEKQLIEFKILFKSLPNYNQFIADISKNMINN